MDSRNRRNLNRLNDELQDVQRVMMQNIDDVLQRGEQLSGNAFEINHVLVISFFGVGIVYCVNLNIFKHSDGHHAWVLR